MAEAKLFVGSLSFDVTDDILKNAFAKAGTVVSAKVIIDRDSNRSKGFGFVEMSSDAEAQAAIAMFNGQELEGRSIIVNVARPMTERSGGSTFNRDRRY